MNNDTQPLTPDQVPLTLEEKLEAQWEKTGQLLAQPVQTFQARPHVHGPFTFLMNQNHNALRGCVACGQAWVGVMAGVEASNLCWHPVQELEEEEE